MKSYKFTLIVTMNAGLTSPFTEVWCSIQNPAIHDIVTAAHPQPHLVSDLAAPMLFDQLTKVADAEESEARLQREVAESFATFAANRT